MVAFHSLTTGRIFGEHYIPQLCGLLIGFRDRNGITEPILHSNIPALLKPADKDSLKLLVAVVRRNGWDWDGLTFELLPFRTMRIVRTSNWSHFSASATCANSKGDEKTRN